MCSDRPQSPSPDRTWGTQHSFLFQKWGTQVLAPSLILSTLKRGSRQEHRARRSSSRRSRLHPNCTVLALASFSVSETVILGDRRRSFHHGRGWRPTFIPHRVCHLHPMAKTARWLAQASHKEMLAQEETVDGLRGSFHPHPTSQKLAMWSYTVHKSGHRPIMPAVRSLGRR